MDSKSFVNFLKMHQILNLRLNAKMKLIAQMFILRILKLEFWFSLKKYFGVASKWRSWSISKLQIMKIQENKNFKILNVSLDYRWSKKKLLIEKNDLRLKANCREVKIDLWQFMEDTKTKKRLRRLRPANKIRKIFSEKKFFQLLLSDIKSLGWKFFLSSEKSFF